MLLECLTNRLRYEGHSLAAFLFRAWSILSRKAVPLAVYVTLLPAASLPTLPDGASSSPTADDPALERPSPLTADGPALTDSSMHAKYEVCTCAEYKV